ncbi:MAG: protoheme IX farnesyltransferase [Chloroflexi bacterium]|nr:protoheme IX farnesyltransferase [Chloroflexota bacterium]
MTRFQRLAAATVVTTFVLVTIGVIVRATDAGLGCPDWPFCYGQLLPPAGDGKAWIEWLHRDVAALVGILILGMAAFAVIDHRDRPSLLWPSIFSVLLVGFQAWLGRETVRLGNSGESVTAHLAAAMTLVGVLVFLLVRSRYPARLPEPGGSQRFTLLAAFAAAATFALLLFGSNVTARNAGLVFLDWPLMSGSLFPFDPALPADVSVFYATNALHRYVAAVVLLVLVAVAWAVNRHRPARPGLRRLAVAILGLYLVQVVIGGLQVLTRLSDWSQSLHLALGTLIWGGTVALAVASYYEARLEGGSATMGGGSGWRPVGIAESPRDLSSPAPSGARRATIRAYIALTKPRIIELLLVTTIPAMVLAIREVPGMATLDWFRLAFWTLVSGTLAAGSANAINQYLDRDLDERMVRTRRRPLPAAQVTPDEAMRFGLVLGVVSVALMAWFVNLLAAFLTLLAIAFYVIVYTILLKRTTTQNIVIGGAAGALPPVIGWAAVTGNVALPAVMLFLLVFYWTPPHFWALALRIRGDYAAAGVPMLPVVKGIAETSRQIVLYTILLVAISLVFAVVAQMGAVYFAAAVVLGAIFLYRAARLWREGSAPEASTAQAIRLYRFSITYLTLLFVAVAVDALIALPFG